MTDEQPQEPGRIRTTVWLNGALAVILVLLGLWFLSGRVSLAEIGAALVAADPVLVAAAVATMLLTIALKALRWQKILNPADASLQPVRLAPAFWALALGQYVNLIVPFLRLGEIARVYVLNQESAVNPGRAVGTLIVEKALDLLFFGLTILFVLPYVVLPAFVSRPGPALWIAPLLLLITLTILALRTEWAAAIWERLIRPLPERISAPLQRLGTAGLEGLGALRSPHHAAGLLGLSLLIAGLGVVVPFLLFLALDLPLSWLDAALVHIVVSIAVAPPSTPVKVGVFNGAAAFVLWSAGIRDETALVSYSILFYLVVVGPQLLLGLVASVRSQWRWTTTGVAAAQGQ